MRHAYKAIRLAKSPPTDMRGTLQFSLQVSRCIGQALTSTESSLGHPTDLTSKDANSESYSSEDWAAAFATLIDHQDVQAVQSLFHLYMNACGGDSANLSPVTTTTLTNPRKRDDNDAQRYNSRFNTNPADESIDINATYSRQLDERVSTPPSLSTRSLDTMRQAADDNTVSLTKTGRPSKPFGSNGEISRTEPEAPAHALETAHLPKGGFAVNTSHPTPDPTASMDIAEVMRPKIEFRDVNGIDNQAVPTPYCDPPEYAEEDYNEHQGAPPNEGSLQSQADYRLRFLSIFIDKFLEHPWNSGDEATEVIAFDAEAFWAADSCYQKYDEEDEDEDEDEYPIALASEEYFQTDKDRRISVLSDFVDSVYKVAKLGPRYLRLEEIVAIHESVTKELRGEAIGEGHVR